MNPPGGARSTPAGWKQAAGGDAAVIEPATGAELGRTGIAAPADIAAAAAAAAAAQPAWAALPLHRAGGDPAPRR